jgi:hypothetical protein
MMPVSTVREPLPMPLDPIAAFAIATGLCAMAIGHTLRMSSVEHRERESRRAANRKPLA